MEEAKVTPVPETPVANVLTGQRILYTLDVFKTVKIKDGDKEQDVQRMYQLVLPYGSTFEEIYEVVDVMMSDLKKLEEASKERAKKLEEEKKAEEEKKSVIIPG